MIRIHRHYCPHSQKLKQLPRDTDLSNLSEGCMRNQKSYLKNMHGLMIEALETQTTPIALLMPRGQEIRIIQNLQGIVATSF